MTKAYSSNLPAPTRRKRVVANEWSQHVPIALFALVLVVVYGFEVFSFNVTIDEDATATYDRSVRFFGSIGEGRWAMAALSQILPNPIMPVVSPAIAVTASGIAWWLISRRHLELTLWQAALACSIAGTVPVLAFIVSFASVAFAIGIGSLLLLGFIAGISSRSWVLRVGGLFAGATAIGIYDTFVIAVAALAMAFIWKRGTWSSLLFASASTVLTYVIAKGIGALAMTLARSAANEYMARFFDLQGLIAAPVDRLKSALSDVWRTLMLPVDLFGLHSPWLAITVVVLVAGAVVSIALDKSTPKARVLRLIALIGLLALPVVAELISTVVVLRSMLYFPVLILVLFAMAVPGLLRVLALAPAIASPIVRYAFVGLLVLAVLGNAAISNRLFVTAATTYTMDQNIAFEIGQEKDKLLSSDNSLDVPTVVVGRHTWPQGAFTQTRETFGGSLFNLNADRSVRFLHAHGVMVHLANEDETARALALLPEDAPIYPQDGWVTLQDGVLVVSFEPTTD
jgi:hypothetical protein